MHWARDGAEANRIVCELARDHDVDEVVKVKSIATDEIELNEALAAAGVRAIETDLAELIIQLGDDVQSHILVPAIHKNRAEIRELFLRELDVDELGDDPAELAEAARQHLRRKFLSARMGVSGANFAIAETGTVCVVESEGNGRMCTTLPDVLVTRDGRREGGARSGATWRSFLQLLPRSSTGERMNPYTSFWSGVREGDGPQEFHLVLLDNGRTRALADEVGRQALRCIRCSACLNSCPVYSRVGGHAYGSVYPGPIGAILTPQLAGVENAGSLPFASSLCGACAEVCPVKIEIPKLLVHLRGKAVESHGRARRRGRRDAQGSTAPSRSRRGYERAQKARPHRRPRRSRAAGASAACPARSAAWTSVRDLPPVAEQTFREWWRERQRGQPTPTTPADHGFAQASTRLARAAECLGSVAAERARASCLRTRARGDRRRSRRSTCRATTAAATRPRPTAVVDRFAERAGDYNATVQRVDARTICRRRSHGPASAHGAVRLGVAGGPADAGVAARRRGGRRRRRLSPQPSSTTSTARSPAARSRSPRPARSCSTAGRAGAAGADARARPARLRGRRSRTSSASCPRRSSG